MSKVTDLARRRWKAILLMATLFFVGVGIGTSGGEPSPAADPVNAAAPVAEAKTVTVEGEPVTVTETKTETVRKRVVKWKTKTVTESESGGGGGDKRRSCHPSYKGACLSPSAVDYDCGGGSGDGPKYVWTTVRVVGYDEYGLDNDGDGLGCD
jgi:hypothetical protein